MRTTRRLQVQAGGAGVMQCGGRLRPKGSRCVSRLGRLGNRYTVAGCPLGCLLGSSRRCRRGWRVNLLVGGLLAVIAVARADAHSRSPVEQAATVANTNARHDVPNYEPIQFDGKDSMTAAQKAKYREIYRYSLTEMERNHVSAERADQFLWMIHFFVPVQYKPVVCQKLRSKNNKADELKDFAAMSKSMTRVWRKYHNQFEIFNTKIRDINTQSRMMVLKPESWDLIWLYSLNISNYTSNFVNFSVYFDKRAKYLGELDNKYNIYEINRVNAELDRNYFNYGKLICNGNLKYKIGDGFKINYNNIKKIEIGREPNSGGRIN